MLAAAQESIILEVFPKGTKIEKQRFELLRKAYVDARYDKNYTITKAELRWLAVRVRKLRNLTGGEKGAKELFKQLTGKQVEGSFQRIILNDSREIVFRATSKSGSAKVEIVDHAKKFLEKISFME